MRKNGLQYVLLALVAALALVVTACSSGGSQSSAGGQTLVVGLEAGFEPFEYYDEKGNLVGYDVDLAHEFANYLGANIEFIDTAFPGLLPGLVSKRFDILISAVPIREGAEDVVFSRPYSTGNEAILVRADNTDINGVEDLAGKIVTVQAATPSEENVKAMSDRFKEQGKPGIEIHAFDHSPESFLDLETGRADALNTVLPRMLTVMKARPGIFKIVQQTTEGKYFAFVTRKNDPELTEKASQFLNKIFEDGTLTKLQLEWFGEEFDLP